MIAKINKKGFTLLELLAVFAIIFLILTFTLPKVLATINNSKTEADIANLDSLNRATDQYKFFLDIENQSLPEELTQQILLEKGFINNILEPLDSDKEFVWSSLPEGWNYVVKDSEDDTSTLEGYSLTDEETNLFSVDDGVLKSNNEERLVITGGWGSPDDGETISIVMDEEQEGPYEGSFLVKHNISGSYSVIVDSELDRSGQLKFIEYGIYFEAEIDDDTKEPTSGYLFQVDYVHDRGAYYPRYILKKVFEGDIKLNVMGNTLYYETITQVDIVDNNKIQISVKNKEDNSTILGPLVFEDDPPYQINPTDTHSGVNVYSESSNSNMLFFDMQIIPYE